MVDFISWQKAKELARAEPVIFVEIMGEAPGERSLEVHVMSPSGWKPAACATRSTSSR